MLNSVMERIKERVKEGLKPTVRLLTFTFLVILFGILYICYKLHTIDSQLNDIEDWLIR